MQKYYDTDLAAAIPHGIIVVDSEYNWLWSNAKAKSLFNLAIEPQQSNIFTTLPFLQEHLPNKASRTEAIIVSFLKSDLSMQLLPYQDNDFVLMIEDVSHTVKLENIRQVFVANVSHELRTPLTVFSGYLEMLLENIPDNKETLLHILQQMDVQKHRMALLVEDLLLLSRLENDELDNNIKTEVSIPQMLQQIINSAQQLSGAKQHTFNLSSCEPVYIYGSADELHSAFSNLIYNAVHYTPENGTINISCYKDNNKLVVAVADTGIGIPEKDIAKITQRFYRVDKGRSWNEVGGTGLGLAIVKHVLIRHDANLEIESKLDAGSCFRCVFNHSCNGQ